jgi:flagellar assembly factor FliW
MKVETSRFGAIEVEESSIIKMPRGLIGFEQYTSFVLVEHRPDTNFRWLQSTEESSLAFVVVDPSKFYADYEVEISDADAEKLNLKSASDTSVLVVATVSSGEEITANLAAPVVINMKEMLGMQVILQDNRYPIKHPLVAIIEKCAEKTEEITAKAA